MNWSHYHVIIAIDIFPEKVQTSLDLSLNCLLINAIPQKCRSKNGLRVLIYAQKNTLIFLIFWKKDERVLAHFVVFSMIFGKYFVSIKV